jgi:uridine kinase
MDWVSGETIQNNDYYKLNRKAFTIGITGGPSSGKTTLTNAILDLLGMHSSLIIKENNYLKWVKNHSKSEYDKSLNIKSYDLLKLNSDLELILDKNIINRKSINNSLSSYQNMNYFDKDFIIVNGHHIFLPDTLNKLFNIRIFLEPEKELNENWFKNKNKIDHNSEQTKCISDIKKYIDLYSQQKNLSDIVFSFSYINKDFISYKAIKELPLRMDIYIKDGIYAENLSKALISICGVKLNLNISNYNFSSKLSIEGDLWAEDIALVAKRLIPNLEEIVDSEPKWQSNIIGLMQLIILMQISYVFKYKIKN